MICTTKYVYYASNFQILEALLNKKLLPIKPSNFWIHLIVTRGNLFKELLVEGSHFCFCSRPSLRFKGKLHVRQSTKNGSIECKEL